AGVEEGYLEKLHIRLDDELTREGPTATALRNGTHGVCQDIQNDPKMLPWRDEALQRGYRASGVFSIFEAGVVVGTISVYAEDINFFTPDIINSMLELAVDVSFALDVFAEKRRREQAEGDLKQLNLELESRVQERTHQLEVANQELEAFSYSVSHDLRAPLRSIDGFSQILSKKYHDRLDDTGRDYLERVRRASQRMGHLIDDLLQLSRVTRNSLQRERIDLSAIAEQVAEDLRKTNPARQVNFVLQTGLSVHADPGLLRVVMDNLLGNAYKFTGKKADAKIEFGICDYKGERAFFIRDNGAGFNMGYAHKLFGAFQRLHGMNEFEGTGIGLATVQRIIHRHHGRVWAEAREGQGATFYFALPQRMRET
ncbi:MAG: ATP-binding protein, partial [Sideroxyarcus sp.]|nr:ATP-binding protein [Sideroxyarcus sp.]